MRTSRLAVALVLALIFALSGTSVAGADDRIADLEDQLRSTTNPDSIRFLIAKELRRLGTIEGRQHCLETLDSIRDTYFHDPEFHKERARAYYEGFRFWDAYVSLMDALELDRDDVSVRIDAVEILYDRMFHRQDLADLDRIHELLDESLELLQASLGTPDPPLTTRVFHEHTEETRLYHRAAILKSLSLYESQRLTGRADKRERLCQEGILWAKHLQEVFPRDRHPEPWLLAAIHQMEVGELEAAEHSFLDAIARMKPKHREFYYIPPQLAGSHAFAEASDKSDHVERYWNAYADPLTGFNEMQLNYWKNCTLADLHYRDPRAPEIHGVETAIGQSIILVGLPGSASFDPGGFQEVEPGSRRTDPTRFRFQQRSIQAEGTRLVTKYPNFELEFEWLHQYGWQAGVETGQFLSRLQEVGQSPVAYVRPPWAAARAYLVSASRRSSSIDSRETFFIAAPAWSEDSDWFEDAQVSLDIVDRTSRRVRTWSTSPSEGSVHELAKNVELLLIGREIDLPPGRYLATAEVKNGRHVIDTIQRHIEVQPFTGPALQLSDLEFAFPGTYSETPVTAEPARNFLPNPSLTVGEVGRFEVSYTVYNLRRDRDGVGHYSARYVILPHDYRLAWTRKLRDEGATEEEANRFAREGHALGGVVLGVGNFRETRFPVTDVPLGPSAREFRAHAVVDAAGLPTGRYVVRVELLDLETNQTAFTELPFSKVEDSTLRRILMAER